MVSKLKDNGSGSDYMKIFLFKYKSEFYKAILNYTRKTYMIYSPSGKLLIERKGISKMETTKIEKEVMKWLNNQNNVVGLY